MNQIANRYLIESKLCLKRTRLAFNRPKIILIDIYLNLVLTNYKVLIS